MAIYQMYQKLAISIHNTTGRLTYEMGLCNNAKEYMHPNSA